MVTITRATRREVASFVSAKRGGERLYTPISINWKLFDD